ncbi:MOSC domain-containing protein [Sphingomonas hylomeconis]|uniref:MOSC domain-containing protein n=1 Tax=Sphingomonas hylomeconis TaxID=1395958 RepID=A0ABV7SWI8_9SPHN|nr:MOSC domain-containing protein [Sphingomonas hylomeconis]
MTDVAPAQVGAASIGADDIADDAAATDTVTGVLGGIARHARPKAACELVDHIHVTLEGGIAGDYRGAMRGKPYRRQVTLIERGDWDAALAEVGVDIPWQERRSNLLIEGLDLPQTKGVRLRIGADVLLEITRETDPCERMEALAPGLKAALLPDWRGGACAMVIQGGTIAVGDTIRIET